MLDRYNRHRFQPLKLSKLIIAVMVHIGKGNHRKTSPKVAGLRIEPRTTRMRGLNSTIRLPLLVDLDSIFTVEFAF